MDVNQPLPYFFTRWPREDSFPISRALGRTCQRKNHGNSSLTSTKAQVSTERKNPSRARISGNHCKLTTRAQCTYVSLLLFTNLNLDIAKKKNLPFQLQCERSTFALGSFRLVSQSLFRFLFHSTTLALDLKNVLVHQGIDKQANVVSRACFSRARL